MNRGLETARIDQLLAEMGFPMTHLEVEHLDWLGLQRMIRGWTTVELTADEIALLFSLTKSKVVRLMAAWHAERSACGGTAPELREQFGNRIGYELTDEQWSSAQLRCSQRLLERLDVLRRVRAARLIPVDKGTGT